MLWFCVSRTAKACGGCPSDGYPAPVPLHRSRVIPWQEILEDGVNFPLKLTELVGSGDRPQLPNGVTLAPHGYRELMEQCWAGQSNLRPTFAVVLTSLAAIQSGAADEEGRTYF